MVKTRAYNPEKQFSEEESNSAKFTLHFLLERFLILVYPVIPQISSFILDDRGIYAHSMEFPKSEKGNSELSLIQDIMDFNSEVWKTKKEKGISLRNPIKGIKVSDKLKAFEKDLIVTHKLE